MDEDQCCAVTVMEPPDETVELVELVAAALVGEPPTGIAPFQLESGARVVGAARRRNRDRDEPVRFIVEGP